MPLSLIFAPLLTTVVDVLVTEVVASVALSFCRLNRLDPFIASVKHIGSLFPFPPFFFLIGLEVVDAGADPPPFSCRAFLSAAFWAINSAKLLEFTEDEEPAASEGALSHL